MIKIGLNAINPVGNMSLLENQLDDVISAYLTKAEQVCSVSPYKGMPMTLREVKNLDEAKYIIKIEVEEKA